MRFASAVAALALLWPAGPAPPEPATYKAEIEAFRKDRDTSLRNDEGWLTLVGLSWLSEGENGVGSGPGNRVLLPKGKAPERLGTIRLEKGVVSFTAAPGADVASDGKPVTTIVLRPDTSGAATRLVHGTLSLYVIKRGSRLGIRVKDREAATLRNFKGVESFPIDAAWRFVATFEKYQPPKKVDVPNVLNAPEAQGSPGAVVFRRGGKSYRLDALYDGRGGELFLVFGDETNAKETYGGGRFLYAPPPAKDGTVVVDFNRAINPPCVFTPYATCPLPPAGNRLALRVTAGERMYGTH
jgi:uncharacterized protein (DUF1684 family)